MNSTKYILYFLFYCYSFFGVAQTFEQVKEQLKDKYDEIRELESGLAQVYIHKDTIVHSMNGEEMKTKRPVKTGFIDSLGNEIIPLQDNCRHLLYHAFETFILQKDKLYALMDRKGNYLTDYIYSDISWFIDGKNKVLFSDNSTTIIDMKGNNLFEPIKNHKILYSQYSYNEYFIIQNLKTGKQGLINIEGKFLIPSIYDYVEVKNNYASVLLDKKYAIVTLDHKEVIPFSDFGIIPTDNENVFITITKDYYIKGLININNQKIVKDNYYAIQNIDKYNYLVTEQIILSTDIQTKISKSEFKSGVFNEKGKEVLPVRHQVYSVFENNMFACDDLGCYIFTFSKEGVTKLSMPDTISFYKRIGHEGVVFNYKNQIFVQSEKYGLMNTKGEIVINPIYDNIEYVIDTEYYIVKNENKFGLFDENGNVMKEVKYISNTSYKDKICFYDENNQRECIALKRE